MVFPYRTPPDKPVDSDPSEERADADIVGLYAVVWVTTLVKVTLWAASGETFGAGLTLLCILLLVLPLLAKDGVADLIRWRRPR